MKIKIRYEEEEEKDNLIRNKNYIGIYILGIRIKKIKLRRKVHGKNVFGKNVNIIYMIVKQVIKSLDQKELLKLISNITKTMKIIDLNLVLGINLNDPILNAYLIALINALLPLYMAQTLTDVRKIYYRTFISEKPIYIKIRGTVKLSLLRNINTIIKIIILSIKTNNKQKNINKNTQQQKYATAVK